jgi:hypothetical protein
MTMASSYVRRYRFKSPSGQPIAFAACGLKGKVYLMAASGAVESGAPLSADHIALALSTFRCKEEFRPKF